ncbi:MAG TPA: SDR family NAD(P)-dependent oxidoreductase [Acidimicrobiales bacterium]|jgi:short-subunit dehydrogenase|nr:SDR family NAD(P)-dependent oxidoreductase [Acidimicrobiales bacterium]
MADRYGAWAVVTGGSSGIGRAFAHGLAAEGMHCLLVSDEPDELRTACGEITARHGVEAEPLAVDLATVDAAAAVVDAVGDRDLGVLVNNASFGRVAPFESVDLETYRRMLAVNVDAYLALSHLLLPAMRARGRGALVFVSSLNALVPGIGYGTVYSATKAFETSLACGLWQETLGTGVDVLLVVPGPTRTRFQEKAGTKVASWAMDPEEVVDGALPCLGRELVHVPGQVNQLLVASFERLTMDRRVELASRLLYAALAEGTL